MKSTDSGRMIVTLGLVIALVAALSLLLDWTPWALALAAIVLSQIATVLVMREMTNWGVVSLVAAVGALGAGIVGGS